MLAETQENLIEAIQMTLETNYELAGAPVPAELILKEKVSLVPIHSSTAGLLRSAGRPARSRMTLVSSVK